MDTTTRCPDCASQSITETLRTWCASYLRCTACGNMWTERLPGEVAETAVVARPSSARRPRDGDLTC